MAKRKRTKWTDAQKEIEHRKRGHYKKSWFQRGGETKFTGWITQETVDDTVWFGNSFIEQPKQFDKFPVDIGDLCAIWPDVQSTQNSELLIKILIYLFPLDGWEQYIDADVTAEDIWLMSKIISAKLYNGKCVKHNFVSDEKQEEEAMARL